MKVEFRFNDVDKLVLTPETGKEKLMLQTFLEGKPRVGLSTEGTEVVVFTADRSAPIPFVCDKCGHKDGNPIVLAALEND